METPTTKVWFSAEANCWVCDVQWIEDGKEYGKTIFCVYDKEKNKEAREKFFQ